MTDHLICGYRLEPVINEYGNTYAWQIESQSGNLWEVVHVYTDHLEAVSRLRVLVTTRENDWTHRGDFGFEEQK